MCDAYTVILFDLLTKNLSFGEGWRKNKKEKRKKRKKERYTDLKKGDFRWREKKSKRKKEWGFRENTCWRFDVVDYYRLWITGSPRDARFFPPPSSLPLFFLLPFFIRELWTKIFEEKKENKERERRKKK